MLLLMMAFFFCCSGVINVIEMFTHKRITFRWRYRTCICKIKTQFVFHQKHHTSHHTLLEIATIRQTFHHPTPNPSPPLCDEQFKMMRMMMHCFDISKTSMPVLSPSYNMWPGIVPVRLYTYKRSQLSLRLVMSW